MDRREFSAGAACVLATAAIGLPQLAFAQGRPEEGKEYKSLDKRVPGEAPAGKIEVVEFFWYSCPHCNAFEPALEAWAKKLPADVVLRRLFYTLEAMGKLEELHRKVFETIHKDRVSIDKEPTILAWAEKQGLDKAKFAEHYNSFSVSTKARKAAQLQDQFKVEGVPALGIAGRWYTDGTMAGSMARALQVTDHLVGEARKTKA
jgi:thiol:disulfide interchange protein DsbA